jgi:hypothetical protein
VGRDILDPLSGNVSGQFFADGFCAVFCLSNTWILGSLKEFRLTSLSVSLVVERNAFVFSEGEAPWVPIITGGQKKPAPLTSAGFLFA